jgi:polysaccharide export outer membrane protein
MRLLSFLCIVFVILLFASCRPQKDLPTNYLQNLTDTIGKGALKNFEPLIQKDDLLAIQVYSNSTKKEISDAVYNPTATSPVSATPGYLVDKKGDIEFPYIGTVHAEGLTKKQLADTLRSKINILESPTVIVRFLNYHITVLGDVHRQGTFTVPYEKVTIFEALGLAGDISEYGRRENVKVLREINGDREVGTIDLTSSKVFDSPYYNLQQGDVIFVDTKKSKLRQADQMMVAQRITLALSLITTAAFIYNIVK